MVGDRHTDIVGARENGLPGLGAGWGYAEPGELVAAGAVVVYGTVADLSEALVAA
jgi:phosphoglycolate phosphatase